MMQPDDISEARELHATIAEHEYLLSFTDDWMSYAFESWWNLEGRDKFIEYANTSPESYDE